MEKATKRYVKFVFDGYLPADLAIQCHMIAKKAVINEVSETIRPIEYFEGEYEHITKK